MVITLYFVLVVVLAVAIVGWREWRRRYESPVIRLRSELPEDERSRRDESDNEVITSAIIESIMTHHTDGGCDGSSDPPL